MSRAQTNQTRADSRRNQTGVTPDRSETRTSRASGLSRTPSAERELLERLSGASVIEDEPDGKNLTQSRQSQARTGDSRASRQSNDVSQTQATTMKSRASRQSQASVRTTPRESRGQTTRQSRATSIDRTSGNEVTETTSTNVTSYETTESPTKTSTPPARNGRQSNKRNPVETSGVGIVRLPEISETAVNENDWRAGKTVQETNSYMLKYEISCDTVFVVDETRDEFKCHRYVLMSRSPVLFPLLQTQRANIRIELPDIKKDIFTDVIQYMYSDMFDVHVDNVSGLLYAAKRLQLGGLTEICFRFLNGDINTDTVPRILELAHEYNETVLYEKSLRYIYNRGAYVLRQKSVELLCASCFEKIIKSNDLQADEEAVYEGAITWANAECRRKKLAPTDEYRRRMLGDMLFLIRFPILNKVYFTQKVSGTDLLSQEEKLSIFQYFHGSDLQILSKFNANARNISETSLRNNNAVSDAQRRPFMSEPIAKERQNDVTQKVRNEELQFVRRFHTSDGFWKQNGSADAITFLTSVPITLRGIEIFGTSAVSEGYQIKVVVIDELRRAEVRKTEEFVFTEFKVRTYDVRIPPIRIPARQPFTLVVTMNGSPTHKGIGGETIREVEGVKFEFKSSNKSPNGTDVSIGQIPGILFTQSE